MDRARFSSTIVTMRPMAPEYGILRAEPESAGVSLYSLGMRRTSPAPLSVARLVRILRRERPQILQTWLYHADLLGLLVGKLARVPAISWNLRCSSMDMSEYSWVSSFVRSSLVRLSRFPDIVLANSQSGLRYHEALGYAPRKWMWIPNSVDLNKFRPDARASERLHCSLGLAPDKLLVGLVARFDPMKDHKNFIESAAVIARNDPRVHFVLVGRGVTAENATLSQWIESTGAAERFHLLGLKDHVNQIVPGFDLACSSSAYGEGFSNAICESLACGIPCAVTDVGDSALLVGNAGKVVPPRNSTALARACQEILGMTPEHRRHLGLCARKSMEQSYSLPSVVDRYERLYTQLAAQH
jgi:glycosyltransferase involved in cell wall biosynthesis